MLSFSRLSVLMTYLSQQDEHEAAVGDPGSHAAGKCDARVRMNAQQAQQGFLWLFLDRRGLLRPVSDRSPDALVHGKCE